MHHDKKICLALGILLVGIVAALFFRNESGAGQQPPQLADAKSLDAQIADRTVRPYDATRPTDTAKQPTVVSNAGVLQPQFTYDGFDSKSSKADGSVRPVEFTQLGPPEPIKPKANAGIQLAQNPDPNAAWTASGTSRTRSARRTRNVSRTTFAGMRTYRVKKGDTLSGIAQRMLGSSRRYHEIYNANRDVLRTPNSVREGMILRIPERKSARPAANEPDDDSDPIAKSPRKRKSAATSRRRIASAPNTPTISDKRFIPVRRSPFLLGRRNGFVSRHGNGNAISGNGDSRSTNAGGDGKPRHDSASAVGQPRCIDQGTTAADVRRPQGRFAGTHRPQGLRHAESDRQDPGCQPRPAEERQSTAGRNEDRTAVS